MPCRSVTGTVATTTATAQEQLGIKDLDSVVRQTALEALVPLAIDKSGVLPAYPPSVKSTDQLQRDKAATFTLKMLPKQRYELSSYEPVSITAQPFSVDEALVDKQIAQIAEKNAEYVTAAEQHEVRPGDSILISMRSFQEDGTRIPGLSAASQTYVCGKGFMPESFDREIIGMKPGEEKSFSFDGPDLDPQGNETSMTVDTTVTVLEIQEEKIPEITDEWLERSGRGFILRETAERYAATEYLPARKQIEGEEIQPGFFALVAFRGKKRPPCRVSCQLVCPQPATPR